MAIDKAVDSTQLNTDLTSVANAIRTKGGTSAQLAFPAGFVSAIGDISGDGGGNANVSQDANGYIVLDDAAPSGGGGTISTSADAIKAYLESNGFVCSEFAVQTPESGDYFSVPHSLGRVPELVFAFNKNLFIEHSPATGYQLGCTSNGYYGADNENNRTYTCVSTTIDNALLYTDCLKNFPLTIVRSQYNFCREASASSVTLRNSASFSNTHMLGTTWILAVK